MDGGSLERKFLGAKSKRIVGAPTIALSD